MSATVELNSALRRSPPPQQNAIIHYSRSLIERIGSVIREFTTSLAGVRALKKGLNALSQTYKIGVAKGIMSFRAGSAKCMNALEEFNGNFDNLVIPLSLGNVRRLVLNSFGQCRAEPGVRSPTRIQRILLIAQNVGSVVFDLVQAGFWFGNRDIGPLRREKVTIPTLEKINRYNYKYLGNGLGITGIGLEILDLATERCADGTKLTWTSCLNKVMSIALSIFSFLTDNFKKVSDMVPALVKDGVQAFNNFYNFGEVLFRGWRYGRA